MYLVNDGKSAHATLPTQQTSKLLPCVPTHAYTDCEISGRRPTRLYKGVPPIHNAGHSKKRMLNWREVVPGSVSLPVVEGEANHMLPSWGAKLGQSLWK